MCMVTRSVSDASKTVTGLFANSPYTPGMDVSC